MPDIFEINNSQNLDDKYYNIINDEKLEISIKKKRNFSSYNSLNSSKPVSDRKNTSDSGLNS